MILPAAVLAGGPSRPSRPRRRRQLASSSRPPCPSGPTTLLLLCRRRRRFRGPARRRGSRCWRSSGCCCSSCRRKSGSGPAGGSKRFVMAITGLTYLILLLWPNKISSPAVGNYFCHIGRDGDRDSYVVNVPKNLLVLQMASARSASAVSWPSGLDL